VDGLELVVVLGATILVGGVVAQRIKVAAPLVLLAFGVGLGFVPGLDSVELSSDVVLLLFLPALLYWESLNTSLREIRSNIRTIALLAVGLVLATAAVVAVIAHAFGLSWPLAITLGAVVAPTDPTAVSSVAGRLPRRVITTLRAESLVNDGTALVVYSVAVAALVTGDGIDVWRTIVTFFASYGLGIVVGVVVGFIVVGARQFLRNRLLENTLSVLTPFLAYLPAEAIGVSGVVSVVSAGLLLTQFGPRVIDAHARLQGAGFWQVTTYLLNGSLFVLIGLEFHRTFRAVIHDDWVTALGLAGMAIVAVIGVRFLWVNTTPYASKMLDRRKSQQGNHMSFRHRLPIAWAGFRGAVSLAAALGIPHSTSSGGGIAERDIVIGVTFAVIAASLVLEGLTMPAVVRWADLPSDPEEAREEAIAERAALEGALEALDATAERLETPDPVREEIREEYQRRAERIRREAEEELAQAAAEGEPVPNTDLDPAGQSEDISESQEALQDVETDELRAEWDSEQADIALRLQLLDAKRSAVLDLRNRREIDDEVMRRVQQRFDVEELRLAAIVEDR